MADEQRRRKSNGAKVDINLDLGLGGLFKGLGDLMALVGDLAQQSEGEATQTGEVKGLGDKVRGVYGVTVRTGIGGKPTVERFGNIKSTAEGPVVDEVREPLVDLFDEGEEILVVAELPGVAVDEVTVEINGDVLALETSGPRRYAREVLLPAAVEPTLREKICRNGILELRLAKARG